MENFIACNPTTVHLGKGVVENLKDYDLRARIMWAAIVNLMFAN